MDPTTCWATRVTRRPRALLGVLAALTFALAAAMPGAAGAVNSFTLDTNPASGAFAAVAVDSAGTGYFAWEHNGGSGPNVPMFCKVPRGGTCANPTVLQTAPVGFGGVTEVDAAFPVLGSGQTVYVVGPRFIGQDVVVWTSNDGGVTFLPPTATTQSGASEGSNPTDVLAAPLGGFYVSSHNPGLAFTSVPASGPGKAPVTDLSPPGGTSNVIGDSTLGLASGGTTGNPVEAWSMFSSGQPSTINFRSYSGTGDPNSATNWTATSQVTTGKLSSLAGGPSGLFLASQDIDAAGHYTQVNVRKYTGSGFGPPLTIQGDTSGDNAGRIFQTPGGRVLVAWPGPTRTDGVTPIRLYDSSNGGTFTRVGNIAEGTPFNAIYGASIRAAAADDGLGFVSFQEFGGGNTFLRVADLTPIKSATATVTTLTTAGQAAAPKLTVGPGTPITDTATVLSPAGTTATGAAGTVAYTVYSDAGCKTLVRTAGTTAVSGGKAAASLPISLPIGTWYYLAAYSGDAGNLASTSACGAEVVTVAPASVHVAGIIFVGGKIIINASFNTSGRVLVTSQVTSPSTLFASAATKAHRCKTGHFLLKVGTKKKCVPNSFGTTTKNIPAPGAYKIKLSPNAAARKALKKGKTLHVKVTLTFKPAGGGKPVVRSVKITVKGKKH
jgi:hypothetical protein